MTKICILYFVGLSGMKQLQSSGSEETLLNGLVALTFRVLQVCAREEAKWLQLKIMRHKAGAQEIEGAQWFRRPVVQQGLPQQEVRHRALQRQQCSEM